MHKSCQKGPQSPSQAITGWLKGKRQGKEKTALQASGRLMHQNHTRPPNSRGPTNLARIPYRRPLKTPNEISKAMMVKW